MLGAVAAGIVALAGGDMKPNDLEKSAITSAALGSLVATSFCSLRTYETRIGALATVMAGTFVAAFCGLLAALASNEGGIWFLVIGWGLFSALFLGLGGSTTVGRLRRVLAGFLIVVTPQVCSIALIAALVDGPRNLVKDSPWPLITIAPILYVACVHLTAPFARVLARAKFEPKLE